tara:strand:+ start:2217 stop:3140 length:924 start_codon:yes stop_codon:yes gene_type:complete
LSASQDLPWHCIIVGGGPAGLTAAIYLARFNLRTLVIDAGKSRAAAIPLTRNHAGFPDGISGAQLLQRMWDQAAKYGAQIITAEVDRVTKDGSDFRVSYPGSDLSSYSVLLASGVRNHPPEMATDVHDAALAKGLLRYCPICDGYEVNDRRIAVLGNEERGVSEALFLRSYSRDITLISPDGCHVSPSKHAELASAGVRLIDGPCERITITDNEICLYVPEGKLSFDTLYPALGSSVQSGVVAGLGAQMSSEGCVIVDSHQRTNVPGLYASGDVVLGLDQISHAMGEGGVAATTIRNDLAERLRLWR